MRSIKGYKRNSPDRGNPYNIIPSGDITMEGVDFPILGIDNLGNQRIMQPGKNYKFPGNEVFELPLKQEGGSVQSMYSFLFGEDDEEEEESSVVVPEEKEVQPDIQSAPIDDADELTPDQVLSMAMGINSEDTYNTSSINTPSNSSSNYITPQEGGNPYADNRAPTGAPSERGKYAFKFYTDKGLPPHVAAGIVGNLEQESGNFRDDVIRAERTGDNGTAFGLAQWRGDRWTNFLNWSKKEGINPYTMDAQLEYVYREANQRGDLKHTMNSSSSREAAYKFAKNYERPKVVDQYRLGYAEKYYK